TAAEDASRAKTAFLSNMSHEIRTPMNAIIGLDAIALADPDISEKTREYLEKIGSSAQHLLTLINDILDMSRIESGRMTIKNEDFSFAELLEQINTMLSGQCEEKGLQYNCRIIGQVDSRYIGDSVKLRQVLINILGNAVKFTHEGGVDLTVERTARFDRKSTLRFVIRDTGIGMSQDYLPHLFDAFSQEDSSATSRYGSSGLGMAITKSIVEMMNGNITVESEKGKGTVFTVTVTLMDSDQDEAVQEEICPQDLAVLIVDDDPVACEHARLVLEKIGIASESADSGEKAIEMVRLRHARRNPYNLLLIDWKMPGMDGVETTRRIRSIIGTESAIIILTAYKWDDIQEEAVSAGVDSFLPKPLFASNVLEEFRSTQRKRNLLAPKKQNRAELAGRRILLAEDVDVNAEIIMMVLSMREIQAEHAENGRVAVEMFEKSPEGYYDAILMDMRMPEMDGLTATTRIRALPRADAAKIPIIALTANAFDEDVQRSLQAGLNAHLSKPVDPENLFETLESLIPA
nr:response regulator [Clostridiales bacterium]